MSGNNAGLINKKPVQLFFKIMAWGVWSILLVFFIQNALASRSENEPRAALLYWMIVLVLALGGGIVYLSRIARPD